MPKMKSHSGAKKRFKVTGTGKIQRRQANKGHLMETKSSRRIRRISGETNVSPADRKGIRRLLNI